MRSCGCVGEERWQRDGGRVDEVGDDGNGMVGVGVEGRTKC